MTQPAISTTLRLVKGSELTYAELDSNFTSIVAAIKDNIDYYPSRATFPVSGLANVMYGAMDTNPPTFYVWTGITYSKAQSTHTVSVGVPVVDVVPGDTWYDPTTTATSMYSFNGTIFTWIPIDNTHEGVKAVANFAALPAIGNTSALYITGDTHKTYYWNGTAYTEASQSDPSIVRGYASAPAYDAGDVVVIGTGLGVANAAIAAGTPFAWGTAGATWSPVLDSGKTWAGAFNAASVYPGYSVVSGSDDILYVSTMPITVASANNDPVSGSARNAWTPWLAAVPTPMQGATGVLAGQSGLVPAPPSSASTLFLRGDATWATTSDAMLSVAVVVAVSGSTALALATAPATDAMSQSKARMTINGLTYDTLSGHFNLNPVGIVWTGPHLLYTTDKIVVSYLPA